MQPTPTFGDRLADACRAKSPLCVGIDPRDEGDLSGFAGGVIAAVAPHAVAIKVNVAFFERRGVEGMRAYSGALVRAREAGLLVIADVKRGDIGATAEAYAEAHLGDGDFGADAATVSPFLGADSLEPFLAAVDRGRGLFVLLRTSNPGAAALQGRLDDPGSATSRTADLLRGWAGARRGRSGWSGVGAVVGATRGTEIAALRARLPGVPFLLPGVGAQGGSLADAARAFEGGLGGLVSASRSITFPEDTRLPWREAVSEAARRLGAELRAALGRGTAA